MDNLELFKECLKIGEPIIDEYYFTGTEKLFIDNEGVIEKIGELRRLITACGVNINKNVSFDYLLDDILNILSKNVKYCEFVAFWKVLDISYSSFSMLSLEQKKETLKKFIYLYCINRENKYIKRGIIYSDSSVQAIYDSGSSRSKGELGKRKLIDFFNKREINKFFVDAKKIKNEVNNLGLNFEFSKKYQGKLPDALFYINSQIFILEAKHINEGGGAQDKQIHELIDFISFSEKNISYVSFLDGTYFNKFINPRISNNKVISQKNQIIEKLINNPNNYFINTYGLEKMF